MPTDDFPAFIAHLKQSVQTMLQEQQQVAAGTAAAPSAIWTEVLSVFRYLMNLSPEDLRNIRFHTGLINGGAWDYWHPYPLPVPAEEARRVGYVRAVEGLPEAFRIGEPPTPHIPRPLGVLYEGRIVNRNVTRYQECIATLYHAGAFAYVAQADTRQLILEVGGGYGGLAHSLGQVLAGRATYVGVDLPEMLLFQGAFLAVNNPERRIYVYTPETFTPAFIADQLRNYDFALLPHYVLPRLQGVAQLACMINMQSFQEMSTAQVSGYLDFAQAHVGYCLYSDNLDCHPYNRELSSLGRLLADRFTLYPDADYFPRLYDTLGLAGYRRYARHLCFPRTSKLRPQAVVLPGLPTPPAPSPCYVRWGRQCLPLRLRRAVGALLGR